MLWQPHFYDKAPPLDYELDDDQIEPWSPDFRTELAKQLAEIAPEAVADGKIDVETLKELLEGDASDTSERFGLFWPGKKRAMRAAQTPTSATLAPDFENSKDWDTTKNVFIEGDNLEVLKILQKHYHGKIKMIYIDPPYNTGKDFVYPDNYREGLDNYLEWSKQVNKEGQKLSTNTDTGGRLHTNWLNMMYPRLKLARNLLTDDGFLFISIDSHESANLMQICSEVFGPQNCVGQFVWKRRSGAMDAVSNLSEDHEYVFVWARSAASLNGVPRTFERYSNPDNDPRGPWIADNLTAGKPGGDVYYPISDPRTGWEFYPPRGRYWPYSRTTMAQKIEEGRIIFPKTADGSPKLKRFASEAKRTSLPVSSWIVGKGDQGTQASMQSPINSVATKQLAELLGGKYFNYPKPIDLLKGLIKQGTHDNSLVLDFFSGSGSTAQAVLEVNAEDGGIRQHIQVQLPEPTAEGSSAREAGFETISELARERIRRAGEQIELSNSELVAERTTPLDTGFRAYKLSDTSFTKWHLTADVPANEVEQHILDIQDSAKDSATQDALLTELLIKQGMSLTERVNQFEVAGLNCHAVLNADSEANTEDQYVLIAYVDEHTKPTLEQLRAIVELQPARLVILEDAFQGDDQLKTNLKQMCVTNDIELKTA